MRRILGEMLAKRSVNDSSQRQKKLTVNVGNISQTVFCSVYNLRANHLAIELILPIFQQTNTYKYE